MGVIFVEILLYGDNIINDNQKFDFSSDIQQEISGELSNGARVRRPWMQQEIPQEFSNAVSLQLYLENL